MAYKIYIDSFDYRVSKPVPRKFANKTEETMWILRNATMVSCFWITETAQRAKLVDSLIASGQLKLDHKSVGYPWTKVAKAPDADVAV